MALSEGLIFAGAYLRREICVSKSIGLALASLFTLYMSAIFQEEGLHLEGRFNGGFCCFTGLGAYIWRGLFSEFYSIITLKYHQFTTCTNRYN